MNERKIVKETVEGSVSLHDLLDGKTPDEVIQKIERYEQIYQGHEIVFKMSYAQSGGEIVCIVGSRPETDTEYDRRIKSEAKEKARANSARIKAEEKERKEYIRLKKKYE